MRKKIWVGGISMLFMLAVTTYSCQKSATESSANQPLTKSEEPINSPVGIESTICGTPQEAILRIMPQGKADSADIGSVTVSNDETNLYVTYSIPETVDWRLQQLRIFVGDHSNISLSDDDGINDPQNPQLGHFKHIVMDGKNVMEYTDTVALSDIASECVDVMAFAQVMGINTNKGARKGWGAGDRFEGVRPAYLINYCIQKCTPQPEECWGGDESATGNGSVFANRKGNNWFEFSTYPQPNGGTVPLISGQVNKKTGENPIIGNLIFSEVIDGKVTITVDFNDGWRLMPGKESVKVDISSTSPMNWNEPGHFAYKQSDFPITVPATSYYAVHLSVQQRVECPTPK